MQEDITIGFIGAGNMAAALSKGLLASGMIKPEKICASDVDDKRRKHYARATGAEVFADNTAVARQSDVIVLAVKPQQMEDVLSDVGPALEERHLIISIAAGITTGFVEKFVRNGVRVVRAMPNTPMLAGAGAVGLCKGKWATDADLDLAGNIFESSAVAVAVDEKDMDAVTALSGSGPAYFFYLAEAMIRAGTELGLSDEHAAALARQTALGAGKMLAESDESPEELRRRVTSPGGTTQAAIECMQQAHVADSVVEAVKAAARRSKELGEQK